ncbi:MAG: aminotransferase class IV [Salinivirgaceae bacterium]|nr:aminotransferase class IV [Salinivirgaceae bacterium]
MYISVNQSFVKEEDVLFGSMPWLLSGQGVVLNEDIRANAAKPILLDKHLEILTQNANILKFKLPDYFNIGFVTAQISGLLTRNKLFQAANVRLTLARNPENGATETIFTSQEASPGPYELNRKGLLIDVFDEAYVTVHSPYQLNQFCQLVNGMAKSAAASRKFDDMLLLTDMGFIVSATDTAVAVVQNGKILTPPLEIGARLDVMRNVLATAAELAGYNIDDEALIMQEDINEADEIFLFSTAKGVQWVAAYRNHRYIHKVSSALNEAVNHILFTNNFQFIDKKV